MANVLGPLLSLSASGAFGKTILYYDTKYGARARKVKGTFPSYGEAWEVNKEWFKLASDRVKTLTPIQKFAWKYEYLDICDVWRDLFMGQQIALWNLSPLNDLSWPPISCPDYVFSPGYAYKSVRYGVYTIGFETKQIDVIRAKICGFRWYNTDILGNPVEDDFVCETVNAYFHLDWPGDYKQYFYAKAYHFNGELTDYHFVAELPE